MKAYIKNFYIRDIETGQRIKEIQNGDVLYKEDLPKQWNIEVVGLWTEEVPVSPDREGSVKIAVNATQSTLEKNPPYCFVADNVPVVLSNGLHTVIATAFTDNDGLENPSENAKVEFTLDEKFKPQDPFDLSIYKDNAVIYLERGKEFDFLNKQVTIDGKKNIIIQSKPGTGPKAIIKYNKRKEYKSAYWIKNCENITFNDICFAFGEDNIIPVSDSKNVQFTNCQTKENTGGVFKCHLGGVDGLIVDNLQVLGPFAGNIGYSGGNKTKPNKNFIVRNSQVKFHSLNEHILRFHNLHGLLVENCELDNSKAPEGGHPLNLRDGRDFVVRNCILSGPLVVGGLEIAGNEDATLTNVTIENSTVNGYTNVYSGVSNFLFKNLKGMSYSSGFVFSIKKAWGNRKYPTGKIENCDMYYTNVTGKFITSYDKTKVKLINNKFQGQPYNA